MTNRLLLAAVVLIVFAGVTAAHVIDFDHSTMLVRAFRNSLHAPGFGAVAVLVMLVLRRRFALRRAYVLAGAIAVFIGGMSEATQIVGPRDADLDDWLNDVLGVIAFLGVAYTLDPRRGNARFGVLNAAAVIGAVAVAALAVWPTARYSHALVAKRGLEPAILTFESTWQRELVRADGDNRLVIAERPDGWPIPGRVGRLSLVSAAAPGLVIQPFADWDGYETFSFLAGSADDASRRITIRVNDGQHTQEYGDRFNREFVVDSRPRRIVFPLSEIRDSPRTRSMDMHAIQDIVIFIRDPANRGTIYVDDFRLE